MPTPDQKTQANPVLSELSKFMRREPVTNDVLAHEVAELRSEIAALRAELAPVSSLILTGRQVLDEFNKLSRAVAN